MNNHIVRQWRVVRRSTFRPHRTGPVFSRRKLHGDARRRFKASRRAAIHDGRERGERSKGHRT